MLTSALGVLVKRGSDSRGLRRGRGSAFLTSCPAMPTLVPVLSMERQERANIIGTTEPVKRGLCVFLAEQGSQGFSRGERKEQAQSSTAGHSGQPQGVTHRAGVAPSVLCPLKIFSQPSICLPPPDDALQWVLLACSQPKYLR